ncbi:hypothetical protein KI387_019511 [Taxus chinensis]|uniref:TFIIS N-terminal domain-containing protein n=1 Tax=Taxus chinensis TaxID=29808 RepID=A0AA38G7E7_TAXCH|nr:hypothetical protein KI387_019511 [Taxus chinensis]
MPSSTQSGGQSQGPSSPAPVSPESSHQSCSKGKKWTWSEQDSASHHQISSPKLENSSAKPQTHENSTKLEDVSGIIETKGGMDNHSGVEQLVFHMQQHTNKFPGEIRQRIKIAGVIAATEQGNCLSHFICKGGLSYLDEWLQDACKGKVVESDNVKEEFIIVLINALEILPINREALKACNIRKSVKHLYNHKNSEIQRKAKNLVHKWKKQVDMEMIGLDEAKGESNHDFVQTHSGESGLLQDGSNLKSLKHAESAIVEFSDELKASGAEVQQNRMPANLDMLCSEEAKVGVVTISKQESSGAKDVGSMNLNGFVITKCVSKPSHLESLSNKSILDAEEASAHFAEDARSSPKLSEKDRKGGSESEDYMESGGGIVRGNLEVHCEWTSVADISEVTDGHISKESQLGLLASTGPLHGHERSTHCPSSDLKVPLNVDSGSPKQINGDLPIACETDEKDKRTELCQKKAIQLTDSGSINTSIRSSINSSFSDHQLSIIPVKSVENSTCWKGLTRPTSECGVAEGCDMRNGNFASEVSGASYSAGNQEDTGTSDGNGTFRDKTARGTRISDESDSKIHMEITSTAPDEKKSDVCMETAAETDLHFLEDDALEVARLVGKEAEQEVESYNEPLYSSSYEKHVKEAPVHSATTESVGGEQDIFHDQNDTDTSYHSKEVLLQVQSGKDVDRSQGNCASEEIDVSGTKAKVVMQELETCKMTITSQESITHEIDAKAANSNDQMKMPPIKCIFDLNEDIPAEEAEWSQELIQAPTVATTSASNCTITNVSTPIPVVAASKGPLNLPTTPLHFKGELGWRGSAATSAFRPAEPRRTPERDRTQSAEENNSSLKPRQRFLEFDLNVADDDGDAGLDLFSGGHGGERHVPASASLPSGDSSVEVSSSRRAERLTLDLNRLCEADDSVPGWRGAERLGALQNPNRSPSPTSSSRPTMRDFDLNDNLSFDDACASTHDFDQKRYSMKSNNNLSRLDDPVVSILGSRIDLDPSKLPPAHAAPWDIPHCNVRKEFPNPAQSFLVSGPSAVPSLNNMGRILSMPSALTYPPPSLSFPYNGVALGSSFPITSAVYAPGQLPYMVESMGASIPQIVGPAAISSSFTRPPYLMGVASGAGTSNAGGIIRANLDLNSGIVPTEVEGREAGGKMRQLFPQSNHMLLEEQIRPYQQAAASGPPLKRKEPECGWDPYQVEYKRATAWQ